MASKYSTMVSGPLRFGTALRYGTYVAVSGEDWHESGTRGLSRSAGCYTLHDDSGDPATLYSHSPHCILRRLSPDSERPHTATRKRHPDCRGRHVASIHTRLELVELSLGLRASAIGVTVRGRSCRGEARSALPTSTLSHTRNHSDSTAVATAARSRSIITHCRRRSHHTI